MRERTEAVIVGGGLIGLTLGIALGRSGIETIVVERELPERIRSATFDGRTSAIAFGSRQVLEALGLWRAVGQEAEPILDIRVADGDSLLFLHYDHRDIGTNPFGHIIENRHLRKTLLKSVGEVPKLKLKAPAEVRRIERQACGVVVHLDSGDTIEGQISIAADGRNSPAREAAGIRTLRWSYPQTAIVCTVHHEKPHRGVAVEHFLPAGPFAILPMTKNRSSIVWTEKSTLVPSLLALEPDAFLQELSCRFGDYLGALEVVGKRWSYPLSLVLAGRYFDDRLVLVGDAAHGIHPIAGQGLNLGFRDVASLVECLVAAHRLGLDLGYGVHLERYQRLRRFDNFLMAAATDGLNRLFSNDVAPLRFVRDTGLAAVNRFSPMKRRLMRHAMGMTARRLDKEPRLIRGLPL